MIIHSISYKVYRTHIDINVVLVAQIIKLLRTYIRSKIHLHNIIIKLYQNFRCSQMEGRERWERE